jgi:type II secretory pathway component PulF
VENIFSTPQKTHEPASPMTLWLFIACQFLVGIHIMFIMGLLPRYARVFDSFGAQLPFFSALLFDISKILDRFFVLSFGLIGAAILWGTFKLFFQTKRDRTRKQVLALIGFGLLALVPLEFFSIIVPEHH